jgi:hypothetical protein
MIDERGERTVQRRFVVNLKGKEFVMLGGLLDLAHAMELAGIETKPVLELCRPAEEYWVFEAIARFENGHFYSAYGDASPANSQMRGAYLRHAETRAIARALRFATNVAMCSIEELGDIQPAEEAAPPVRRARHDPQDQPAAAMEPCEWPDCPALVDGQQARLSRQHFHRCLCAGHEGQLTAIRAKKEAKKEPVALPAAAPA